MKSENWNELDILYDLLTLYEKRLNVEKNKEKVLLLNEIIDNIKETMNLIENYLIN